MSTSQTSASGEHSNPLDDPAADPFAIAALAAEQIAEKTGVTHHDIALTLGSGWAKAADLIGETTATIPATEIAGFSKPALEGHVGSLRSILLPSGKRALVSWAAADPRGPWPTRDALLDRSPRLVRARSDTLRRTSAAYPGRPQADSGSPHPRRHGGACGALGSGNAGAATAVTAVFLVDFVVAAQGDGQLT